MDYQRIYESLGFLFYGIAAGDGAIRSDEVAKLNAAITDHWLNFENSRDDLGTDAARYIGISFDYAMDTGMRPAEAFERFKAGHHEAGTSFDAPLKRLTLATADAIANAHHGRNKHELTMLAQLRMLLNAPPDGSTPVHA